MNDVLYTNGKIYTVDADRKWAEAVAVKGNRITFAGSAAEAEGIEAEKTVDLKGKMMLPGFIEGHAHATWGGIDSLFKVQLFDAQSEEEYVEEIRKAVEAHPELPAYEGVGWANAFVGEHGPSRKLLDQICDDKPMIMTSGDKHSIWLNTFALEKCGIGKDTTVPAGNVIEREPDGTPSGTLREFAAIELADPIKPVYSKDNYKEAVKWVQRKFAEYGVTAMMDPVIDPEEAAADAIIELEKDGELICKLRGAFKSTEKDYFRHIDDFAAIRKAADSYMFKIDQVKIFADGVVEGKTAFMKEPYDGETEFRGDPIWDPEDLIEFCTEIDKMGFDIHVHSIGDAALAMTLDTLDAMRKAHPERDRRPVITHLQVVDPQDIPRLKDHNVAAVVNPYWFFKAEGWFENLEKRYLGDRAYREYPIKCLADAGITIGAASDYNVTPVPAPLRAIQLAATRVEIGKDINDPDLILGPEERMSVEDMVEAFTMGNAYALGIEDITGSIEPGKCADFVILDRNIFEVPLQDIHKVKVVQTISEGKVIYEA